MRRLVVGVLFAALVIVTLAAPSNGTGDDDAIRLSVESAGSAEQAEDYTTDSAASGLPEDRPTRFVAFLLLNGYDFYQNLGGERHDAIGRWFLRRLAGLGLIFAQRLLAIIYENGYGGAEQNYAETAFWYRMAADQGDADSQLFLGGLYLEGRGVEQSDVEAVFWIRKAAEQGNLPAISAIGGAFHEGRGVPQDFSQAVVWFRRAAEKGNAFAQYSLGTSYYLGHGVAKDRAAAFKWTRMSAEQGEVEAQFNLGIMYERGEAVPADPDRAGYWYRLAADQGHEKARKRLEALQQ